METMYTLLFRQNEVYWFLNTQLHRDNDLPAVECFDGYKGWCQHSLKHRINGPACIWGAGEGGNELYYIDGQHVTYKEWKRRVHNKIH